MLVLLQHYFFYTGHEATFTHIKWEAGFHGFDGQINNIVIRAIVMAFILVNTFYGVLIVSIAGSGFLNYYEIIHNQNAKEWNKMFIRSTLKFHLLNSIKVKIFVDTSLNISVR